MTCLIRWVALIVTIATFSGQSCAQLCDPNNDFRVSADGLPEFCVVREGTNMWTVVCNKLWRVEDFKVLCRESSITGDPAAGELATGELIPWDSGVSQAYQRCDGTEPEMNTCKMDFSTELCVNEIWRVTCDPGIILPEDPQPLPTQLPPSQRKAVFLFLLDKSESLAQSYLALEAELVRGFLDCLADRCFNHFDVSVYVRVFDEAMGSGEELHYANYSSPQELKQAMHWPVGQLLSDLASTTPSKLTNIGKALNGYLDIDAVPGTTPQKKVVFIGSDFINTRSNPDPYVVTGKAIQDGWTVVPIMLPIPESNKRGDDVFQRMHDISNSA